ncbi:MAG TPA: ABC transporter permease [Acidobacteriaceae bacterium]|nr:ABC transporter permease [Acidobacteriaceae bacterium]
MNWLARTLRKLFFIAGRDRRNRELEEEMAFHRGLAEKELVADGLPPDRAHYAVIRQFGNEARLRDESAAATSLWCETALHDLRFAVRQLRRSPGFAATAILILTLGIGAAVAIFSFVDAALIRPLPYRDSSRLAILYESIPLGPRFHLSYLDYLDWKQQNTVFSSLDVYAPYGFVLQTPAGSQQVDGVRVSAGFFRTLGVTPVLGRDLDTRDEQPNQQRTALLSYAAWQRRFGGRKDVLGQSVTLDGNLTTIVGVLPRTFHFAPAEPADFWGIERSTGGCEKRRDCHNLFGVARLKPGVSFNAAFADIRTIADNLARQYPDSNRDQKAFMLPITEVILGDIRPILLVVLAGASLLLLIAAVNVASLLLVRTERRRRETAVRGALGASRARLIRQFVTEGMVLALSSGVLGVLSAWGAMDMFLRLLPKDMLASMPYLERVGLNPAVLAFAVLVALAGGLFFSLLPAWRVMAADIRDGLAEGARGSSGTVWRRFGSHLVVAELAMAVVLLVGAGLLGKSLYRLLHTDLGLVPDHLALLAVVATGHSYDSAPQQVALERQLQSRLSMLPGVRSVAFTTALPLGDADGTSTFSIVGVPPDQVHREVAVRDVSANYFSTLEARLVSGRYFVEDEDATRPRVVVINQQLAKQYFPGQNPIGRQVSFSSNGKAPMQIVGLIDDIQEGQLDAAPRAAMYLPFLQSPGNYFAVVIRTTQREDSLLPVAVAAVHQVDPRLAVDEPITMAERLHDSPSASLHRCSAWLVGGFAVLALVLSTVGLYGVIAYSVGQRTREIGVRMALGAQRSSIYRLILRQAGALTLVGILFGLTGSLAATSLVGKLLFQVRSWDLTTLAAVALVLAAAAMVASFLPAHRAASVNPTEALHAE